MSDLKITHAGTVQTQDRQGPMNPYAPFGQVGSIFVNTTANPIRPPLNQVFIAFTFIEEGSFTTLIAEDEDKYINTNVAAHNKATDAGTSVEGENGLIMPDDDSVPFPAGLTIYGRWIEFELTSDTTVIAYIG
tara:strand:+ start:603 stop:1001 length:399 start_codon:yes stop_codon:yes gene_type:complete